MGVYIKGMQMPKSCFTCPFREKVNPDEYVCLALKSVYEETFSLITCRRNKDCPLIPVPDHGDLIDRDEQIERAWRLNLSTKELIDEMLRSAPTVLPADREGEA